MNDGGHDNKPAMTGSGLPHLQKDKHIENELKDEQSLITDLVPKL